MRRRPMALLPSGTITLRDTRRSQTRDVALEAFEIAVSPVHARDSGVPRVPFPWSDAVGYCNELSRTAGMYEAYTVQAREVEWNTAADGYRLPTEAEWDYSCRAGTTSPTYGPLEDIAWTNLDHLEGINSGAMGVGRMRRLASTCHAAAQRAGEQVTSSVDGGTSTLQKDHGDVFKVFPAEVSRQVPRPITAWGRAVWEGAEIGPDRASAYLTEDTKGGLFYRWTAPAGVTLHAGIADQLGPQDGLLQAAQLVRDGEAVGHYGQLTEADLGKAYPVRWIDGGEDRQTQESAPRSQFPGATQHRKIEGVWTAADGQGLLFTLSRTSEGEFPGVVADQGMVVYYSFAEQTMTLVEHWAVGGYVDSPDTITVSPWGGVVIAEDGSDPNHLVAFTERTGSVALAKDLAERGEWAGPCFGTGGTLFANVQSVCTYLITGPRARHLAR